jgi:hypothetical protein
MDRRLEILKQSLKKNPTDWRSRRGLVDLYVGQGDFAAASATIGNAPVLPQQDRDLVEILNFLKQHDASAAHGLAERAMMEAPERGASHLCKSLVCELTNQPDAAARHRARALEMDSSLETLLETAAAEDASGRAHPEIRKGAASSFNASKIQISKRKKESVSRTKVKQTRRRRLLVGKVCVILLTCMICLFALFKVLDRIYPDFGSHRTPADPAPIPALGPQQSTHVKQLSPSLLYKQHTALLDLLMVSAGYLEKASTWQEMLPFVRSAATTRPKMQAYYRDHAYSPISVDRKQASIVIIPLGKHPFAVIDGAISTDEADQKTSARQCAFDLLTNPPRLDWESFVGWNPVSLGEFANTSRLSDQEEISDKFLKELRVLVSISTRNLSGVSGDGTPLFDLSHPDEPGVTLVGIPATNQVRTDLLSENLNQRLQQPAILLLAPMGTKTPDGASLAHILNVEQLGWVRADQ